MLSYFFLYDVKPRPPFLAPFKDTSTQIEGGKEYVNSPKCSTFPIEWIPLNCRDDWVINQCGEVKIISLLLFFIRISNKLGKNTLLKHIACTTLVVHGWVFEGVSGETGVHFYSYEGFAYIKVEKNTSHPRAQSNSPTGKKKTGSVKCYMFQATLARYVTLFLSGRKHIV